MEDGRFEGGGGPDEVETMNGGSFSGGANRDVVFVMNGGTFDESGAQTSLRT